MIKIFVTGASGNVGKTIVRTALATDDFELAGGWCVETGLDIGSLAGMEPLGIKISPSLDEGLASAKPDIVIDFSITPVLENNLKSYLNAGLNAVIGTTGLTDEQLEPFRKEVEARGLRWAAIPNYGLGISLVSDFIKRAREFYPFVTITDQHTNEMANAPSGTAAALAKAASEGPSGDVKSRESYPGVLGGKICGVQVLSQRLPWPGPYSGHEITLARKDEVIRVTVQDYTSDIYMDGVFLTARKLAGFPAGSFIRSLSEVTDG
ncbi:MAG: 4-hydroxy-tetrahydrodipicolinate reductase [Synergistaceae bacterium]|jgi:4-hydroxy-tetrahydrodipicolinate reductase|nr:4-hydroxy-tetrahydrodipicolinate reductase [Synergistaceae bacterium]